MTLPSAHTSHRRGNPARKRSAAVPTRCAAAAIGAVLLVAISPGAQAQTWRLQPMLSGLLTYTDNVSLEANGRSDWVLQLTPTLSVSEKGAHTSLGGTISAPILLYARTSGSDDVRP